MSYFAACLLTLTCCVPLPPPSAARRWYGRAGGPHPRDLGRRGRRLRRDRAGAVPGAAQGRRSAPCGTLVQPAGGRWPVRLDAGEHHLRHLQDHRRPRSQEQVYPLQPAALHGCPLRGCIRVCLHGCLGAGIDIGSARPGMQVAHG